MTGDEDISCADGTKDGLHVKINGRQVLVITADAPGNTDETIGELNEGVILHEHPNKINIVDEKRKIVLKCTIVNGICVRVNLVGNNVESTRYYVAKWIGS